MNIRIQPLIIQHYIALSQKKGVISFAAGLPDMSVLPLEEVKHAYSQIIEENAYSFQYQPPIASLKEKIQAIMETQSVECRLEEILITNGAQQAIYLTANLFLKDKAALMIEEFVYPGYLQIVNRFDLEYLPIPCHFKEGMDLDCLETYLKTHKPLPYFYVVCNGHNPQATTLDVTKRKQLAYLAEKYEFIIVEDDPYGYLNFSDEHFLPLRAYTKNAIYIGSFSKIISPSLRIGWIVAEQAIIQKLHQLKDMNDLYLSNPNHLALYQVLNKKSLSEITQPQKTLYKEKRDCLIKKLYECLKIPFYCDVPKHGMFVWVEFPDFNIEKYQDYIFEESKVLFIPACAFSVCKKASRQAIRLNFTYPSLDEIKKGVQNLSTVLNRLYIHGRE